jgi:hypothetical protein
MPLRYPVSVRLKLLWNIVSDGFHEGCSVSTRWPIVSIVFVPSASVIALAGPSEGQHESL